MADAGGVARGRATRPEQRAAFMANNAITFEDVLPPSYKLVQLSRANAEAQGIIEAVAQTAAGEASRGRCRPAGEEIINFVIR